MSSVDQFGPGDILSHSFTLFDRETFDAAGGMNSLVAFFLMSCFELSVFLKSLKAISIIPVTVNLIG